VIIHVGEFNLALAVLILDPLRAGACPICVSSFP